jgi:crossover junction endodeoxyribonuclease RuvC
MNELNHERIILGIDPGTTIMGYGLVGIIKKEPKVIALGVVDLQKITDHYLKLKYIFERTVQLIDSYNPDELAIEAPFYGKNVQSMLKLGRAQGTAIAAALSRQIPIFEYAPRKIKLSITGRGSASKEQVAGFLKNILDLKEIPKNLDATDGLAVAMCHYYQKGTGQVVNNYSGWKDFLKKNPDQIIE